MRMISLLCASILLLSGCDRGFGRAKTAFDGQAALGYVKAQLDFGPRTPGTPAHDKAADWIVAEMKKRTDSVSVQRWTQTTADGTKLPLQNILARFNPAATQRVLYVTHWDTRPKADDDPNFGNKARPILGANDGASGVGLFIALGDVFKKTPPSVGVDLLFVDGEDWGAFDSDSGGHFPDALFGSQYFANHLPSADYKPLFGVLWDMIGDADLQLYQEANSVQRAPEVVSRVWQTAADLGYEKYFISQVGPADHRRPRAAARQRAARDRRARHSVRSAAGRPRRRSRRRSQLSPHDAGHVRQGLGEESADRGRCGGDVGEVTEALDGWTA